MIRLLTAEDIPQVLSIANAWQGPKFWWPEDLLRAEFADSQGYGCFDPDLKAFILVADRTAAFELTCLASHKETVRQGHMTQLLEYIIQEKGRQKELWLEVHEINLAARNLYEKWGFEKAGERPSYYKDGGAAVLYTRKPS